jgi:hypothetical protein
MKAISILKTTTATLGAIIATNFITQEAKAVTLTFDDISANVSTPLKKYSDLNWSNLYVYNASKHSNSGYNNGAVSQKNIVFNLSEGTSSIRSAKRFDFNKTYLSAAWNNDLNILVEGFFNDNLKYSKTVTVNPYQPQQFNFNFLGINKLTFKSFGGTNAGLGQSGKMFVMDNFVYNETKMVSNKLSQSVPEPVSTLGIAAMGIIGVITGAKRITD